MYNIHNHCFGHLKGYKIKYKNIFIYAKILAISTVLRLIINLNAVWMSVMLY